MVGKKLVEKNQKKLTEEKARLAEMLKRVSGKEYPDFGTKDDENAAEVTAYETNLVEERDLAERLAVVSRALDRIKNGSYGICKVGGEEMDEARLKAAPEAENCVKHADK